MLQHLVSALRVSQVPGLVIRVFHGRCARQLLLCHVSPFVIFVLIRVLPQHVVPAFPLAHGRQHIAQLSVKVVDVIRVVRDTFIHAPLQHCAPLHVREGVGHVPVLVRLSHHLQHVIGIQAFLHRLAVGINAVAVAAQRIRCVVLQVLEGARMSFPRLSRAAHLRHAAERRGLVHRLRVRAAVAVEVCRGGLEERWQVGPVQARHGQEGFGLPSHGVEFPVVVQGVPPGVAQHFLRHPLCRPAQPVVILHAVHVGTSLRVEHGLHG